MSVPFNVSRKFPGPEFRTSLRDSCPLAVWVSVPEATVYKDNGPIFLKTYVWRTGKVASMETETQPERMQDLAHDNLRAGMGSAAQRA